MTLIRIVTVDTRGYGSALAAVPDAPGCFYMLTDRGPNFDVPDPLAKGFAEPSFRPHIGRFELRGDTLVRTGTIGLSGADGQPLSGLPNLPGEGSTGEVPVALDGTVLPLDSRGIDPEGLVALTDGSFWISDEYGPALLHLDANGQLIERVSPLTAERFLPRVLARRWPNHGLEGLTLLPDGRTLAAIMQSALDNPEPGAGRKSRNVRLVMFDTASGATRQYVYLQEEAGLSNSALAAVSMTTFLTVEHDKKFTHDTESPSRVKRVYKVDLTGATDVSDTADHASGLLVDGQPLEGMPAAALRSAGIEPVQKFLVTDLVSMGYPYDKPEGLAMIAGDTIAVLNDDDFGIASDDRGGIRQKFLPGTQDVDRSTVWFIRTGPLR